MDSLLSTKGGSCELRFGVAQFDHYDPLAEIDKLAEWGFDYVEPAGVKIMQLSETSFREAVNAARACPIHVEAMCTLLPADLKIVGPGIDLSHVRDYVGKALARAEVLGVRTIMFGSPSSRNVPDGFSRGRAWDQLQEFLLWMGDEIVCHKYGFVIAVEPLRKAESNIINNVAEAYDLVIQINHPKIQIVVDFFHLAEESEEPTILVKAKDKIAHLHFANPWGGRSFPSQPMEHPGYAPFFANVRAIGYRGRLSLEANTTDFHADAPRALAALRQMALAYPKEPVGSPEVQ
ncbi:Sugar phosphate isomerase/epimerase [Propionivibrio dicarboxylicus]|uniref:Sugar phosphate isomerase/epimerase n=2 Tax=Propionivibrio dicarboxylicus TaxID=83767 RepID=A0A1G8F2A5_9RHOO|nr:Sugar phosphate isomerase/epimerase [Propionivibrio dicarboxylicus]